jgi:hypothetical protein
LSTPQYRLQPSPLPLTRKATFFVDYEEKVFEDVKAEPGEKALVTFRYKGTAA